MQVFFITFPPHSPVLADVLACQITLFCHPETSLENARHVIVCQCQFCLIPAQVLLAGSICAMCHQPVSFIFFVHAFLHICFQVIEMIDYILQCVRVTFTLLFF